MNTQAILVMLIEEKKTDLEEIINQLYRLGMLTELRVVRALIKREFMDRQGKEESGRKIMMDLAVKYDCSFSHVSHCVYRHPEIRV